MDNNCKMDNNNSVCFVSKIANIAPIKGADNIELILVNGWYSITKKGLYKSGDLVIIATTDAVIPSDLADKMGIVNYLRTGNRVRTIKLKNVYSECLIIPFKYTIFVTGKNSLLLLNNSIHEGMDCMKILNIYKYEPPVKQIQLSSGKKIKWQNNLNFQVYYKFPNFKNVNNMFNSNSIVQISRKIHGSNARYGIVKKNKMSFIEKIKQKLFPKKYKFIEYEYIYGSHNVEKGSDTKGYYSKDIWDDVAKKYNIKQKLTKYTKSLSKEELGKGIVIYGEIYGEGIQKNYNYNLNEHLFAGFDVSINLKYQDTETTCKIFKKLNLDHVPILYTGQWSSKIQDKFVINNYIQDTKIPHEGVVVKDVSGQRNKIAKVINPDYLIYSEKNNVGDSH